MNRLLLFGNLVIAFVASRLADIGSTYYFIPELGIADEANPLVSIAKFQWIELLIFQVVLGMGVILFAAYYSFGRTEPVQCESHTLRSYASICLFNQDLGLPRFLRGLFLGSPIPTNWHQLFRFYGFTLIVSLTAASYFAAASWWMNHYFQVGWFTYLYQASGGVGNYPLIVVYVGLFALVDRKLLFFLVGTSFCKIELSVGGWVMLLNDDQQGYDGLQRYGAHKKNVASGETPRSQIWPEKHHMTLGTSHDSK